MPKTIWSGQSRYWKLKGILLDQIKRFKQNVFFHNIKFGVLYQLTEQNVVWQRHLTVYLVNASVAFLETITCCRVDFHSCSVTAIVVVGTLAFKVSVLHDLPLSLVLILAVLLILPCLAQWMWGQVASIVRMEADCLISLGCVNCPDYFF